MDENKVFLSIGLDGSLSDLLKEWLNTRRSAQLDRIEHKLDKILQENIIMAAELDTLTAAVSKNTDVEKSAVVLLQGLKKSLDDAIASGNPKALTDLSTQLGTSTAALADAVVANTPAA